MGTAGKQKIKNSKFELRAVQLSSHSGVLVNDVAESLMHSPYHAVGVAQAGA